MAQANELVDIPLELYVECIDQFDRQDPDETERALKSISGTITQLLKAHCCNIEHVPATVRFESKVYPDVNSTTTESMELDGVEEETVEKATSRIENLTMQPTNRTRKSARKLPIPRKPLVHQMSYKKLTTRLNKLVADESEHPSTSNGGEVDANALADRFFEIYSPRQEHVNYVYIDGRSGRLTKDSLKNKLKIKLDDVKKYGLVPLFKKAVYGKRKKVVVPLNQYKQLQSVAFLEFRSDIINRKDFCVNDDDDVTELMDKYVFWSWCTETKRWKDSTDSQVKTTCMTILQQAQKNKSNKKMATAAKTK